MKQIRQSWTAEWDVGGDRDGIIRSAKVAEIPAQCKNTQAHHTSSEEEHLQEIQQNSCIYH